MTRLAIILNMVDYSQLKVPDLKKLLGERGLVLSGNKADLIARLQEDDTKKGTAGAGKSSISIHAHISSPSRLRGLDYKGEKC